MKHTRFRQLTLVSVLGLLLSLGTMGPVHAGTLQSSGSSGMQGTISAPAPQRPPTISVPVNGRTFTSTPVTVSGLCTSGLLVKLFSNNIFVGSVQCSAGSFSLQTDLFSGQNDLVARQYDALDQASPDSNTVSVNFQDSQFSAFGEHVSLTSTYAKLGADVGSELSWPIVLSGGSGPYAISVDWGDGSAQSLQSQPFAGQFNLTHIYQQSGVYRVVVRASDTNGQAAYLQLVGVGNGKVTQANGGTAGQGNSNGSGASSGKTTVIWWPLCLIPVFMGITFWLGKRYELQAIHRQLERRSDTY